MEKAVDYDKRMKICQALGADMFKDVVLRVERLKYKVIKKFFPNYISFVDKHIERAAKKKLKKATTDEEKKQIIDNCRRQKLAARKEMNWEQNRNYHLDGNRPTEILEYLNWNKKVHNYGMLFNIGALVALGTATVLGIAPALSLTLMVGEAASLFVNFQCVNLQNYNICRIKKDEERIIRLEAKKNERNIRKYAAGAQAIGRSLQQTNDIPTVEEVASNVQSKEEVEQLLELIRATRRAQNKALEQNKAIDESGKGLLSMFSSQGDTGGQNDASDQNKLGVQKSIGGKK